MSAVAILQVYLSASALLAIAYFAFREVRGWVKHRPLLRVAHASLLLALLAPLAFHAVPRRQLPRLEWSILRPGAEVGKEGAHRRRDWSRTQGPATELEAVNHLEPRSWIAWPMEKLALAAVLALLVGIACSGGRLFRDARGLCRVVRSALIVRTLGRVRVAVSDSVAIPFSVRIGWTRWVILPASMLEHGPDYRLALRHELQHHRQGDTTWAILVELMVCAFFWNPAAYLWKRELSELQEISCDEALLRRKGISAHEYGSCLLRVAETALRARRMYAGTTCMAAGSRNPVYFKSFLRRRIEMFSQHGSAPASKWAGIMLGTLTAILTVTVAFAAEQVIRGPDPERINAGEVVVDPEIQKIADQVLASAVAKEKAKAGFAIVADPRTGKILAVANIDTTRKLSGYWALSELFEPASIMKGIVAASAIEKGVTTPQSWHACENGRYRYGDRVYHDWKKAGWDHLTTTETIAYSSDICAIKIGESLGTERISEMLVNFGFGPGGTAQSFPGARPGVLPPPEDPNHPRLVPYVSEGAGFDISPLEMVQAYGAIANGGNLMKPLPASASDSEAQVIRRVLSPESAEKTKQILRQVVLIGTGKPHAQSSLYTTAGKTATSHYPRHMPFDGDPDYANFIGFAPVKDPRVEVYVGIRDPESPDGAHGSNHAGPVFRELTEAVLKYMKVTPGT